jgi:hypothetical protein
LKRFPTDYPFPWTSISVYYMLAPHRLSDAERIATLGDTAEKRLGIAD